MCGEKCVLVLVCSFQIGSPPHVRGKEERRKPGEIRARITPACAGKRQRFALSLAFCKDHPRMCGEKAGIKAEEMHIRGSPPHVRGKAL